MNGIEHASLIKLDVYIHQIDCFSSIVLVGKPISMKSMSPVGNVAYGLAMAFFMNYLQYALTGLLSYYNIIFQILFALIW